MFRRAGIRTPPNLPLDPSMPVRIHHKEPAVRSRRYRLVSIVDHNVQREAALLEFEKAATVGADTPATAMHNQSVSTLVERNGLGIRHRNLMNNLFVLPIPEPDFIPSLQIGIDFE